MVSPAGGGRGRVKHEVDLSGWVQAAALSWAIIVAAAAGPCPVEGVEGEEGLRGLQGRLTGGQRSAPSLKPSQSRAPSQTGASLSSASIHRSCLIPDADVRQAKGVSGGLAVWVWTTLRCRLTSFWGGRS